MSDKAVERKAVRPLEVELTLPEGATLSAGDRRVDLGQLEGRVHKRSPLWWWGDDATGDRAKAEWVIEAPEGRRAGHRSAAPASGHDSPGHQAFGVSTRHCGTGVPQSPVPRGGAFSLRPVVHGCVHLEAVERPNRRCGRDEGAATGRLRGDSPLGGRGGAANRPNPRSSAKESIKGCTNFLKSAPSSLRRHTESRDGAAPGAASGQPRDPSIAPGCRFLRAPEAELVSLNDPERDRLGELVGGGRVDGDADRFAVTQVVEASFDPRPRSTSWPATSRTENPYVSELTRLA